ncbi:response regulator [Phenylobacterium sp.]|uniref:response regulator n=1 Tax=Phenylobacterium sp. TaxID=1871053 RepID=UPI002DE2693B|nr:response regulator [Phenylobacterium sp.]
MRILHIDDNAMNLLVLDQMLAALGHQTVAVATAKEALALLGEQSFDVIITDIHMPEVDGVELLRRVRASEGPNRDLPVVAVTADVMSRREDEYRELGFAAIAAKPLLMPSLERVLNAAQAAAQDRSFASAGLKSGYGDEDRAWLRAGGRARVAK